MSLLSSLAQRAQQRRAYRDLMQLDDRLLMDLGFNRDRLRQELAARRRSQTRL